MVLAIFKLFIESTPLMIGLALLEVVSVMTMNRKIGYLTDTFGGNEPPDLWYGIPAKDLYDYLGGIGIEGRAAYLDCVYWDVMLTMPAYTLLLGSLLYRECESAGVTNKLALIFPITMICDAIETIGCGYAAKIFPKPLKLKYVDIISTANRMKWAELFLGSIILAILFLKNLVLPRKSSKEDPPMETKKTK